MTDTTHTPAERTDAELLRLIANDHERLAPNAYHSAETLRQIAARLTLPKEPTDDVVQRVAHLEHVIDRDRYIVAAVAGSIRDAIRGRTWLLAGRGPYEWDDDRYREEFADALAYIEKTAEPLAIVGWDKADCTRVAERVDAARQAAREILSQPHKPRGMIAADLGLPCPACTSLPEASQGEVEQIVAWLRKTSWKHAGADIYANAIERGDHRTNGREAS